MAVLPLSTSQLNLCAGVPFHSDFQHTRWFASKSEQTIFFDSRVVRRYSEVKFTRLEGRYAARVEINIEQIRNVNYLYFNNGGRTYYCFVTNLEYNNERHTIVHFELDYIQTYLFDISFRQSYIAREHTTEFNTNNEGLNYGDFYENVLVEKVKLFEGNKFLIVVCKEPLHDVSDSTVDNTINTGDETADTEEETSSSTINPSVIGSPQPLTFYALPFNSDKYNKDTGGYTLPSVTFSGGDVKFMSQPLTLLKEFYSSTSAVNNIVSMYITEYPGFNMTYQTKEDGIVLGNFNIQNNNNQSIKRVKVKGKELYMLHVEMLERTHFLTINVKSMFRNVFTGHANDVNDKLKQSPYSKIVLDDMKGHRVEYLPEYIKGNDLILNVKGGISHNNQIAWGFENYTYSNQNEYGEQIVHEHAVVNSNPQDVAILNDNLAAYMQGNKNSLKVRQDNIMINAMMGTFNGATNGVSAGLNAGGVAGVGAGIGTGLVSTATSLGTTAIQTQQEIKGMQAQLKDISNVPPSIQSMGANIHFDYSNKYDGIYIIYKQITSEYRRRIADYFKMYGYKTDLLKVPNINTHTHFNYVQTKGCNITGNFNNEVTQNIKRIFDNGITLWHVDGVCNYNVLNTVRSGG